MTVDLLGHAPVGRVAGMGGHQSASAEKEVWLTPPDLLKALGPFDLDPCAVMLPRPWPTADQHFTRIENGLTKTWRGRVFANPPYGGPEVVGPWMRRIAEHGHGTALIFARTDTEMFHAEVFGRATAVLFLEGRLHFHHADGRRARHNSGAPSCLVAYGSTDASHLAVCGLRGRFLALK